MVKKSLFRLIFSFIFLVCFSLDIYAANSKKVVDLANVLNSDASKLQTKIQTAIKKADFDIVVVTTKDAKGKSARSFADDYFDYNDYGMGSDHSGILLLIDLDNNELWISTSGYAIDVFTDKRIESMLDNIYKHASKKDYYKASLAFVSDVEKYAKQGVPSGQYREDESGRKTTGNTLSYSQRLKKAVTSPIVYIIPLIVATIALIATSLTQKGKVTVGATTYEARGTFKLQNQQDVFLTKSVSRVRRQTSSSGGSSGRSSTHTSSSGRSHGGGGRRL